MLSSQRRVEQLIEILAQPGRVKVRKPAPPLEEDLGLDGGSTYRAELGDRLA